MVMNIYIIKLKCYAASFFVNLIISLISFSLNNLSTAFIPNCVKGTSYKSASSSFCLTRNSLYTALKNLEWSHYN